MWHESQLASGLLTDLYHVDAAYVSWRSGLNGTATFDLYTRSNPFGGTYLLVAGLELAASFARQFHYSDDEIAFLQRLRPYEADFYDDLRGIRFTGEITAMPEGEIAFAPEPVLRVTAPFRQALLLEAGLLHTVGVSTLLATKAARIVYAARGKPIAEFGFRRAQEPYLAARSAAIGGCASTSFVAAAQAFDLPSTGTVPHSLIQAFPSEEAAFRAIAASLPEYTLLLDTYDVNRATETAVKVAHDALTHYGHRLVAVRLDSGDLAADSRHVRHVFDAAGLAEVRIFASGDLDEYKIASLLAAAAPIDAFGVGTSLAVGAGAAERGIDGGALGAVYKLVWYDQDDDKIADDDETPVKVAGAKSTWPGKKQVHRLGDFAEDLIALESEPPPANGRSLLEPVLLDGNLVRPMPSLSEIRRRAAASVAALPAALHGLESPPSYPIRYSERLQAMRDEAVARYGADPLDP